MSEAHVAATATEPARVVRHRRRRQFRSLCPELAAEAAALVSQTATQPTIGPKATGPAEDRHCEREAVHRPLAPSRAPLLVVVLLPLLLLRRLVLPVALLLPPRPAVAGA